MNDYLRTICALLLTSALLSSAMAQDEPSAEDGTEEIRRYTVEVIIFSYAEDFGRGSEEFYPDAPPADEALDEEEEELGLVDEVDITPARPGVALSIYLANKENLRYVPLTEDEYTLTGIIDRFELLDAYDTVMHFGWTQPTLPPEYTKPVSLHMFGRPPEGLDGRFELYLSRYLHLVVDLALAASAGGGSVVPATAMSGFDDPRPGYAAGGSRFGAPVFYRIREDRIFKNGDIRYFDHPKFGVVAKVTRVEEETEETAGTGSLLGQAPQ